MGAYRNTIANFVGNIDVSPVRRSNLVEVSFYSEDPELAARISNELCKDYIFQNYPGEVGRKPPRRQNGFHTNSWACRPSLRNPKML